MNICGRKASATTDAALRRVGSQRLVMERRDIGSTLLEIVISIVLLGTIVAALVAAVLTTVRASSTVFEVAQVDTVLVNASDHVARARQQCDYETIVDGAALAENWPIDAISVSVEILQSNTGSEANDWAPQSCTVALEPFDVQRLTIVVDHPTQSITRSITVVKSNVE